MHKTENVELTVLCLLEDGDKVLLQNRVKDDWKGYALPGGHVEPGESFVSAVIREMQEETGLLIHTPRLVGVKHVPMKPGKSACAAVNSTGWSGKLSSSAEGQMEWVDYDQLMYKETVDDLETLLDVMNTPELNELQHTFEHGEWVITVR